MKHTGWRKPTPGLVRAEEHAQAGEQIAIPKSRALLAVKKVAIAIGLKPGDIMLLDTLGAFSKPQDWEEGRRPIVWASNDYLMHNTGFSLSALHRHMRRLTNLELIAFRDSSNGKRWGRRNEEGIIIEAYGFDLSPLAARAGEFEALYAQIQEERELCSQLKRTITIARRIIRSKLEMAINSSVAGSWSKLMQTFETLLARLPRGKETAEQLLQIAEDFKMLQGQVEAVYRRAHEMPEQTQEPVDITSDNSASCIDITQKMTPRPATDGTHIQFTNQPINVNSNISEKEKVPIVVPLNGSTNKPYSPFSSSSMEAMAGDGAIASSRTAGVEADAANSARSEVDISTVMQACPDFAEIAHDLAGYVRNWGDFHRVAGQIRPMAGISEDAWNLAQQSVGPYLSATMIALIFDKYSKGEVASPGGYLRGMVDKAKTGDLHLARSIYGRLNETRQ